MRPAPRVKSLRSHLSTADLVRPRRDGGRPGGPPPLPAAEPGAAIEVERSSQGRAVTWADAIHRCGDPWRPAGGHPDRGRHADVLRPGHPRAAAHRPSPLTWDQACRLRGARPAGPPPRPSAEPVTVQRRASNTGVIMVAGQKIALGRIQPGQVVTAHVAENTITIDLATATAAPSAGPPARPCTASKPTGRGDELRGTPDDHAPPPAG